MSKLCTLFIVAFLLCLTLTFAARPDSSVAKPQFHVASEGKIEIKEAKCEGVEEEECLKRRTMAAHLDYIYTQSNKNP
ncbi:phytosulfokines 3 [Nicotiana tabacum]|uniref:Phytosulfokine n=2 Tax=Nicotiana TaxID=4085 RepID=A0A1S4B5N3_TOBAC|nr:PREDICTED: phytosulfokines 3-like isoform X2 [Nicotiana sylvestris]XP_016484157.1 PREDICTED: phytosulfokines 3-like [Nicotiana tabacum]